jgi:hypothetical protein
MELPKAEVKKLFEHATNTAKQYYKDGGNFKDRLPSTSPHTLGKDDGTHPNSQTTTGFSSFMRNPTRRDQAMTGTMGRARAW